jgi:predicted  nucleic acid-binding Zn-ribbon protein
MENLLTIFIVVTAAAVVLQAGILVALFLTFKKTVEKMEVVIDEVKGKTLPSIQAVNMTVTDLRPKVEQITENLVLLQPKIIQIVDSMVEMRPKIDKIVENLVATTSSVRSEVQRVDATVNDPHFRSGRAHIRSGGKNGCIAGTPSLWHRPRSQRRFGVLPG